MTKIDLDKFICSLIDVSINGGNDGWIHATDIQKTLKEQGLECKNGEIVETSSSKSDFKFEEGKWYICYNNKTPQGHQLHFTEGKLYKCNINGYLKDDYGNLCTWWNSYADNIFRLTDYKEFNVGDWCIDKVDSTIFQITEVLENIYKYKTIDDKEYSCTHYLLENDVRKWTINDAKVGDVLVASDGSLFIFAKVKDNSAYYHFSLCKNGSKEISDGNHAWETANSCHPATKEQRDLLFFEMKEAGYGWDDEKKELKKIEQKPTNTVEPKFKVGDWVVCEVTGSVYQIKNCIESLSNHRYGYILTNGGYIGSDEVNNYHLWTIQDAKDGDILTGNKKDVILMFRGIGNTEWDDVIDYHCYYDCYKEDFIVQDDVDYWGNTENNQLEPATKEQRGLLFQKMKEAGYEWDDDKFELRKIDKKEYQPRVADYEDFREWKDEKETTSEYKFKEGDWIIYEDNDLREILKVTCQPDNEYICDNLNGENRYLCVEDANEYKFWSINDTKPGDVLVWNDSHGLTCIALIKNITYNYLKNEGKVELWFSYFTDGYWEAWNGSTPYTNVTSLIACDAKPANKRERDLLFQKMKEIGYEFDAENKKLIDKVNYASIINNFKKLMKESKPIPSEIQKVINENFWEML